MSTVRILLVEDNPGDARLLQEYLSEPTGTDFQVERAQNLEQGLRRAEEHFDIILLDLFLPDSAGLETFAKVHQAVPHLPIIVMSGLDDESQAIRTVHEGAQDYLVKGQFDSRLLVRAIRYAIERKQTQEALIKERDLLHSLLDNLPDRIYFKDLLSRFMRISRALAQHFNLEDPRLARGKTDSDFFGAAHAQATEQDERRIVTTGEPVLNKVEQETLSNGQVAWVLTSKMPLRDRHGNIVGSFGISRDITPLKRIENELAAERNLLRSLIDNLPDYIYIKDTQGRYLLDNIAHRRFLGVATEDEVVGRTSRDFFPADIAGRIARDDQAVFATGQALLNHEEQMVVRDGQRRWHITTKVPLRGPDQVITGLVGIGRDITERKLADEQLQQANAELARSKEDLMVVLADLRQSHEDLKAAQFQLIQAEKMQSIGRLAAGVAHEVKNPLAILGMGIEYLSQNVVTQDENVALILNDMSEAMKRADSIIHGLLDFSVPHALHLRPVQLGDLLEQSLSLVRHELSAASIRIVRELAPDLPACRLDPNKIKQAFVNLLSNSIHAMPQGGTLTVRTSSRTLLPSEAERDAGARHAIRFRAGDAVVVGEILDTGTGIAEDKLVKIFDPFFTTKPTGQGTGLGLTVTKKIIELHGGTLEIRNRKEGGVAATVVFKI